MYPLMLPMVAIGTSAQGLGSSPPLPSSLNYPASYFAFSSNFAEPAIPLLQTEYSSNWFQHKWFGGVVLSKRCMLKLVDRNENVSHIASGYWYNSASQGKVRIDETYNGALGSSLFDYTNTSKGEVSNQQWLISPSVGSKPTCFNEYVADPGFPLLTADFLRQNQATFGGIVVDPYVGESQTWLILFAGTIPATVYLNNKNVVLGYDFFGQQLRTRAITRFYNIGIGKISSATFANFPC